MKKRFSFQTKVLLCLLLTAVFSGSRAQTYCTGDLYYYGCYLSGITEIHLGNLSQTIGCTGELGVIDLSDSVVSLAQGETYNFTLLTNSNYSSDYVGIWVDLNDDFDFDDPGEYMYSTSFPTYGALHDFISIDPAYPLGTHRMRIRTNNYYSFASGDACTPFYYGSAVDLSLNITGPAACPGIPSLSVAGITIHTAQVNWSCNGCEGPFYIEYGPVGFVPGVDSLPGQGTLISIEGTSSNQTELMGLQSATDYQVFIRRYCPGNGFSTNHGPIQFTTVYDVCSTISPIECNEVVSAIIPMGLGAIHNTNCYPNPATGKELIYEFIPQASGIYTLNILSTTALNNNYQYAYYSLKEAQSGCNEGSWSCIDFIGNTGMWLLGHLDAGTPYYLMVDAGYYFNGAGHIFSIDCYEPYVPGDSIIPISCGVPAVANIPAGHGAFDNPECGYSQNWGKELIFQFTAPVTGMYSFSILANNSVPSYYSAYFSYKKTVMGTGESGWNCIGGFSQPGTYYIGTLVGGESYYILADAFSMNVGINLTFQVDCTSDISPCTQITQIEPGVPVSYQIPSGIGAFYSTGCGSNYQTGAGKEKIFQFTPSTNGLCGIHVSYINFNYNWDSWVKYYYKKASYGCGPDGWNCLGQANYWEWLMIPEPMVAGESYYILADATNLSGAEQTFLLEYPDPVVEPCSQISPISCGDTVNTVIPEGWGSINLYNPNDGNSVSGKEKIYSFYAESSGTHLLTTLATNYKWMTYFIRDAAGGCSNTDWTLIQSTAYPSGSPITFPFAFLAGSTYYLMVEADSHDGTEVTFTIQCPDSTYHPCDTIPSVQCGLFNAVDIPEGIGSIQPSSSLYWPYLGKEEIFEFTPSVTGNYMINIDQGPSYNPSGIFYKPASLGCNSGDWQIIYFNYSLSGSIPGILIAGTSYFFMVDKHSDTPLTESFQIVCPTTPSFPCDSVTLIPQCGVTITTTIPPGLGSLNPLNGCYNNSAVYCVGKEQLFSFTPTESGKYGIVTPYDYWAGIQYFAKPVSESCTNDDWHCMASSGTINLYYMEAGIPYYILADAPDTLGITRTFDLICAEPDPCSDFIEINACSWNTPVSCTIPVGFGSFTPPLCLGQYYQSIGREKIFRITPPMSGNYGMYANFFFSNNEGYCHFYIKNVTEGCNDSGLTCLTDNYGNYTFPYPLMAGNSYYLIAVADGYTGSSFDLYISCPNGCEIYSDSDGDGYGNPLLPAFTCWPIYGYVPDNTDCNDFNPDIHPCAVEWMDGIDNDCDGISDEICQNPVSGLITGDNQICSTCLNGALQVNVTGGVPPFSYQWSNGSSQPDATGLAAGFYSLTITDATLCQAVFTHEITVADIQNIQLSQGWNIFSTYINPFNTGLNAVLSGILNSVIIVKDENGETFWPQFNINSIGNLTLGKAYKTKMANPRTLIISGIAALPESSPVSVSAGWGMLGYLRQSPAPIAALLSPILNNIVIIKNQAGQVFWPGWNVNGIGNMLPGEGYLIKTSSPCTLVYPANADGYSKLEPSTVPVRFYGNPENTGHNMTLGIMIENPDSGFSNGEFGIFDSGNHLVGTAVSEGVFTAITLWGDDELTPEKEGLFTDEKFTVRFMSYSTGEQELDTDLKFIEGDNLYRQENLAIATLKTDFTRTEGEFTLTCFPNPFSGSTAIGFSLPAEVEVKLEVLNPLGQRITSLFAGRLNSGPHEIPFTPTSLASGTYFIRLSSETQSQTTSIRIEK